MIRPSIHIAEQTSRYVNNKEDASVSYFMSQTNRELIHKLIIKSVYEKTNGQATIGRQSDNELQVVMIHTIQEKYNQHLPIVDLNRMVVQQCSNNIIQNIGYYTRYIHDLNAPSALGEDFIVPQNTRESKERSFNSIF